MNTYGLYVTAKHIQTYVNDYHEYGIDYMGQDNDCAEDKQECSPTIRDSYECLAEQMQGTKESLLQSEGEQ